MTAVRMVAIALIFCVASLGWLVLGGSVWQRTESADAHLRESVGGLYGRAQAQSAPAFTLVRGKARTPLPIAGSDVTASFDLDQRRKGLQWYATYQVDFAARYTLANPGDEPASVEMRFTFPDGSGVYDGFEVIVDGKKVPVEHLEGAAVALFELAPKGRSGVSVGYRTGGLDEWRYVPSGGGPAVIEDFTLTMLTDFEQVDFPDGGASPNRPKERTAEGWKLTWEYDSVVSGREIALVMPQRLQPGPLAARISLFAPVALLFYFAALVLLTATRGVRLHPMHYAFLAAGFFAFHLLLAYLADHLDAGLSFAICSIVSTALCVGYLQAVIGRGRALFEIAASQTVFLVAFSYSFFFEGLTGLAVAIGSVLTLAYFMAKTARVSWDEVFTRPGGAAAAPETTS